MATLWLEGTGWGKEEKMKREREMKTTQYIQYTVKRQDIDTVSTLYNEKKQLIHCTVSVTEEEAESVSWSIFIKRNKSSLFVINLNNRIKLKGKKGQKWMRELCLKKEGFNWNWETKK